MWDANWTGTALSGTRFITASSMFLEDDGGISNRNERSIQNIINETRILPEQQDLIQHGLGIMTVLMKTS